MWIKMAEGWNRILPLKMVGDNQWPSHIIWAYDAQIMEAGSFCLFWLPTHGDRAQCSLLALRQQLTGDMFHVQCCAPQTHRFDDVVWHHHWVSTGGITIRDTWHKKKCAVEMDPLGGILTALCSDATIKCIFRNRKTWARVAWSWHARHCSYGCRRVRTIMISGDF